MNVLRVAVIGGGHLGRIHAGLVQQVEGVQLVGIVDPDPRARGALAERFDVPVHADLDGLLDQIDAAIIAAPTACHFAIARDCLVHGLHVFVEKPLTIAVPDADQLVQLAREQGRVLQVGHVEQFNPAFLAVAHRLRNVRFVVAQRTSRFTGRCLDVGAVLDLMIHDLQLVLTMCNSPVIHVEAVGQALVSEHEDVAIAWLRFADGAVAQLTASRVSPWSRRQLEIQTETERLYLDLEAKTACSLSAGRRPVAASGGAVSGSAQLVSPGTALPDAGVPLDVLPTVPGNAILDELREFVAAIREGRSPRVDGLRGRDAVELAQRVLAAIASDRRSVLPVPAVRRQAA